MKKARRLATIEDREATINWYLQAVPGDFLGALKVEHYRNVQNRTGQRRGRQQELAEWTKISLEYPEDGIRILKWAGWKKLWIWDDQLGCADTSFVVLEQEETEWDRMHHIPLNTAFLCGKDSTCPEIWYEEEFNGNPCNKIHNLYEVKKHLSSIVNKKTGTAVVQLVFTKTSLGLPICEVWASEPWLKEIQESWTEIWKKTWKHDADKMKEVEEKLAKRETIRAKKRSIDREKSRSRPANDETDGEKSEEELAAETGRYGIRSSFVQISTKPLTRLDEHAFRTSFPYDIMFLPMEVMYEAHSFLAEQIGWKDGNEDGNFKAQRNNRREAWEAGKEERYNKRKEQESLEYGTAENPWNDMR